MQVSNRWQPVRSFRCADGLWKKAHLVAAEKKITVTSLLTQYIESLPAPAPNVRRPLTWEEERKERKRFIADMEDD